MLIFQDIMNIRLISEIQFVQHFFYIVLIVSCLIILCTIKTWTYWFYKVHSLSLTPRVQGFQVKKIQLQLMQKTTQHFPVSDVQPSIPRNLLQFGHGLKISKVTWWRWHLHKIAPQKTNMEPSWFIKMFSIIPIKSHQITLSWMITH